MLPLQKTPASLINGKLAPESAAKNVSPKTPTQAAKPSVSAPSLAAPKSASSLAAAAGLPPDKLSSAIVSFARFFSLPLKPQTLAAIRSQTFSPQIPQSVSDNNTAAKESSGSLAAKESPSAAMAKSREALSMAAAAAESKDVELQPKGLEAYAEAVDPEWQKRHDGEHRQKRQNKNQDNAQEKSPQKAAPITASALEKMALGSAANEPLLAILNKLPDKNGRRWIVLPFDFSQGDKDFKVSMRILLEDKTSSAACMVLDIAESGENTAGERRWLFMLESAGNRAMKLTVYIQPELAIKEQRRLKDELSALLEIQPQRVFIKNSDMSFPCEADRAENTVSVDKVV